MDEIRYCIEEDQRSELPTNDPNPQALSEALSTMLFSNVFGRMSMQSNREIISEVNSGQWFVGLVKSF